ncbi:salivary glue protein Sgs-3-like [Mytilus trossulus]|uniref:salivary glue protein Sgs-3-like n=1 Tax=Mytilus trossulus TaxID=6551 RepID=UPI0030047D5E
MSTTSQPTTAGPTVVASTTILKTTMQPTTVQPTTVQPTTVQPTTVQPNTAGATTGNSSSTVGLTNTTTVQATSSIPTTTVVTVVTSSTNKTCTDDQDSNFSCAVYEMKYDLCKATTGTLFNIAQKRCQAFCGICAGNNTSGTPPAFLPTQPTCIDHDARCSQAQFQQICLSAVSQNFVISTCPKSCNKCAEYLASLNRK